MYVATITGMKRFDLIYLSPLLSLSGAAIIASKVVTLYYL